MKLRRLSASAGGARPPAGRMVRSAGGSRAPAEQLSLQTHAAACRCPDCARGPGARSVLDALADKAGPGTLLPVVRVECPCGEVVAAVTALGGAPRSCLACGRPL